MQTCQDLLAPFPPSFHPFPSIHIHIHIHIRLSFIVRLHWVMDREIDRPVQCVCVCVCPSPLLSLSSSLPVCLTPSHCPSNSMLFPPPPNHTFDHRCFFPCLVCPSFSCVVVAAFISALSLSLLQSGLLAHP